MINQSNEDNKKPSVYIGKVKEKFDKTKDSTTRSGSYKMSFKEKQAYKEELYRRYGFDLDKKTELEKEIKRLENLERVSRRTYDYRGADEYKDKINLIKSLIND